MQIKRKPRNLLCAVIGESLIKGDTGIWIDAHRIGGSVVRVSPRDAKRIGKRLTEMADWIQNKPS